MRNSARDKREVQSAFEATLNIFDRLGREPDAWEQSCLVDALCSMAGQRYDQAAKQIIRVVVAVRQGRSHPERAEREKQVTKAKIRMGLTHIRVHD